MSGNKKAAIQFSGGKDSLALVYLLADILEDTPVYWANAGDPLPETLRIVDHVRTMAPKFIEVRSDVLAWQNSNGFPVDVVPSCATPMGRIVQGNTAIPLVDKYRCCWSNIMEPLHRRMIDDGVAVIIRGVKSADQYRANIASGDDIDGIAYIHPLEGWTDRDVLLYLRRVGAPIADYYSHGRTECVDCRCCTAWWDKGHAEYMRTADPEAFARNRKILEQARRLVQEHMRYLDMEIGG